MKSLLRGTGLRGGLAFAFAAQTSATLVNVFLSLVVARRLSVEDFSYWQLFTFYSAFVGLAALGLEQGVYLRCAGQTPQQLDAPLLGGQFRLLLVHTLVCSAAVAGLSAFAGDENRRTVLLAVAVGLVFVNASGFLGGLLQTVGQTRLYSASVLLTRLLFLCFAVGLLVAGADRFQPFLAGWLCAQGAGLAFCMVAARRAAFARGAPLRDVVAEALRNCRAGLPLLLAAVLGGLVLGSGRLVVDRTFGIVAFGQFSFALALVNLLGQFIGQVGMVLFPALKRAKEAHLTPAYRLVSLALELLLPLPLLVFAPLQALLTLWLPRYAQSFAWLALLLPLCLFDGKMQILYATFLKIHRRERTLLWINAAALAAALGLSLLAASLFGRVEGVALALVAASALRCWLGCRYAAPLADATRQGNIGHMLLALAFVGNTWFLPPLPGFLAMLCACVLFWLAKRENWQELAALWRDAPWKT